MKAEASTIAEQFRASEARFSFYQHFERDVYFSLRERAYQLEDKVRFGLVALNAGTVIAIITAASKEGLAGALDISRSELIAPLLFLIAGVIAVGASVWSGRSQELLHASDSFSRVLTVNSVVASLQMPLSEETFRSYQEAVDVYHQQPLVGFQFSKLVTLLQGVSLGFWVAAITMLCASILGWL